MIAKVDSINPTKDRILVERVKLKQTEGGILIPDTNEDDNIIRARIKKVGPQVTLHHAGDMILITKYAGVQLEQEGDLYMITEHDILAGLDE